MRMTQGAVDYRSTVDQRAGLQQPIQPGAMPGVPPQGRLPVPGQDQPGWYAPPPPQQGGQPFAMPQPQGAPGTPNPYAAAPPQASPAPAPAPEMTKRANDNEDAPR